MRVGANDTMYFIRADKSSGFRVGYPKKPETRTSGSGRVGLFTSGFFGSENTKKLENSGRVSKIRVFYPP